MGEATDQIESHIARTREDLRSNLEELETRVKAVADWRAQFRRHPAPMMVAALVGGMLVSALIGKRD